MWQARTGPLPASYYYNLFALPPWWSGARGSWRVLVIGLGGGTAWRVLEGCLPEGVRLESSGIEIDPVVAELGARWMDLAVDDPARRVLAGWDGRAALHGTEGSFDQVVLDAYANQFEIPAHLSTREFFGEVESKLVVGGWLVVNVGAFGLHDPIVSALGATAAAAFERPVLAVRVPFSRNCVLFARRDALPREPGGPGWRVEQASLDALLERLQLPGSWRWLDAGDAVVLTDDLNALERLQRQSITEGPSRWVESR